MPGSYCCQIPWWRLSTSILQPHFADQDVLAGSCCYCTVLWCVCRRWVRVESKEMLFSLLGWTSFLLLYLICCWLIAFLVLVGCLLNLSGVRQMDNQWERRHDVDNLLACLVPLADKRTAKGNGILHDYFYLLAWCLWLMWLMLLDCADLACSCFFMDGVLMLLALVTVCPPGAYYHTSMFSRLPAFDLLLASVVFIILILVESCYCRLRSCLLMTVT